MNHAYQNQYMDPEYPHVTEAWENFQDRVSRLRDCTIILYLKIFSKTIFFDGAQHIHVLLTDLKLKGFLQVSK